jgi:replicative DNA helicase
MYGAPVDLSVEYLETHCRIVADYASLRATVEVCRQGIVSATTASAEKSPREIIDSIESLILEVQVGAQREKTSARAADVIFDTVERIEKYEPARNGLNGIGTGFRVLDRMTGGLTPGQLVIVAGRPSMGKTAFALNLAMNVARGREDGEVAVFSLEMDTDSLMERLLSSEARVSAHQWRRGAMTPEEIARINTGATSISSSTLWIDDHPTQTVLDIRSKCRRLKASPRGLKLILIDYLQLLRPVGTSTSRSREQEVAQMSLALKGLARELKVPVICLSQLSRSPEQRQDKRPMLSDLRDSGSIEQDADLVAFLFRPEYYFRDDPALEGAAELILAKQRNGPTGSIPLYWHRGYTRFDDATNATEERFSY